MIALTSSNDWLKLFDNVFVLFVLLLVFFLIYWFYLLILWLCLVIFSFYDYCCCE